MSVTSHVLYEAWAAAGRPGSVVLVSGRCRTGADALADHRPTWPSLPWAVPPTLMVTTS
ncbi:MAG TPA: hypothetical protein VIJ15_14970 [Dermatophilaceae bacterium]